ncbi:MAG TPA: DMT family transporter [Variovorax sp.]|nr:DMT family transporter [Variovorax sp.]
MTGPRHTLAGIVLVVLASAFFGATDTASKFVVTAGMPVLMAVWARYVVQAIATSAVVLPTRGWAVLRTRRLFFHCLRGVTLFSGSILLLICLRFMPVGEITAIMMLAPLLVTLLAATMLKESVSALRWLLVAGAFIGTVVIMRPGGAAFGWVVLLPLGQVLCNTAFQLLTSKLARTEDPLAMHMYTGWVGALLASAALPFMWQPVANPWLWGLLVLMGLSAAVGHLFLILAYQRAPASTLTPYIYAQIGFAMFAGWLVFGHVPDGWAALGMGLIAACGVVGAWLTVHEGRVAARALQAAGQSPSA